LRKRLEEERILLAPGVYDALTALIAEQAGFEALYLTGAGIAYTRLGRSDIGLVTASEVADTLANICDRVRIPVIVDADTGFGNALNVRRTVEVLERAGADAIQIEDQVFPKRCGHFEGKEVVATAEMLAKIKAVVDARLDPDLLVVARTDAIAVEGFAAAIDRAHAYRDAGADVGFVEAPITREQITAIGRLPWPQLINVVVGGKTPEIANDELQRLGFAGVIYANAALQAAVLGMQRALSHLKQHRRIGDAEDLLAPFAERQRLVDIEGFQALERRYK
jgi:2-methylisocitrate lyase-like PEP mutase family enzyme